MITGRAQLGRILGDEPRRPTTDYGYGQNPDGTPVMPGSPEMLAIQAQRMNEVRDPYGNVIDPNNLPDNMRIEEAPLTGRGAGMPARAVFKDDYARQPGDPGYQTNHMFRGLFQPTTRFSDMPVAPSGQAQEIAQMQMKQQEAAAKNFSQPLRGSPLQQIGAGSSPFGSGNMRQAVMGQPSPRQAQSQGIVPMLAGPRGGLAGYQRARQMGLHSAFRI
jgi:hypothetical protein